MNLSSTEEVVVEFPQLTKKSLKSTSVDWFFGDCGQGDETSADETYQISSCQLFQGKLGRIELTALCLLGPSGQDLSATLNDNLQSPSNTALTDIQQKYLIYLIDNNSLDLDLIFTFKPNMNHLRNSLLTNNCKCFETMSRTRNR